MNLASILRNTKRHADEIVKKNKNKMLFLCFFLASISVGIVGAVVYNWIYIDGSATIEFLLV
jgi:type I restriction-modification system DNA methylase subunit